jgi:hypothetical protein
MYAYLWSFAAMPGSLMVHLAVAVPKSVARIAWLLL